MIKEGGQKNKDQSGRDRKCRSLKENKFFKKVFDMNSRKNEGLKINIIEVEAILKSAVGVKITI